MGSQAIADPRNRLGLMRAAEKMGDRKKADEIRSGFTRSGTAPVARC